MQTKKSSQIKHPGTVESVHGNTVVVRVESQAACGQCHAKSHCGMVESADKLIEVSHQNASEYKPGENVIITLKQSLGYRALLLGYIIPFLILLLALFAITLSTGREALAALVAVLLMIPYYVLLYRYRHKLRKTFHFELEQGRP